MYERIIKAHIICVFTYAQSLVLHKCSNVHMCKQNIRKIVFMTELVYKIQ